METKIPAGRGATGRRPTENPEVAALGIPTWSVGPRLKAARTLRAEQSQMQALVQRAMEEFCCVTIFS